ncbi:MAG: hypothetical protein NT031_15070, partial [Planctomycetota bacterium]|nr:hypothetical protein [Planctomycetota bacterium]
GMEKRLAGLEGLLKQASDRVLAQALADYQRDLETELGKVRSRSMKIATVYREDQAAARDGVERLSILADRTQELDDLRQKLARLDDKLRDLRISAQAAEPPVRILDTYLLSPHNPSPTTKPDK